MSNFIELTDIKTGDVFTLNLDYIEEIIPHKDGGTMLAVAESTLKVNLFCISKSRIHYHVRESYNLIKQKIFARQRSIHPGTFTNELREEVLCRICDKLCRFPHECNQDELDEKCENCSLSEVLKS